MQAHQTGEPQLRGLLLGSSPTGIAAVHPALRETAAWLVSLDPAAHRWLVDADPETIATYPIITSSPGVRQAIVEKLLDLAQADMLRSPFTIRYNHLAHLGLADQVRSALRTGNPRQQQLAIEIGGASALVAVLDDLIDLALDDQQTDGC